MSEQDKLQVLGITGEWIWGDDAETTVFAQAFGKGKMVIFRFSLDKDGTDALPSWIVNCYHGREVPGPQVSFPTRHPMRVLLMSAIASIWPECSSIPDVGDPDAIVNVFGNGTWNICYDRLFTDYIKLLLPLNELSVQDPIETVGFKTLARHHQLGGRGCTSLVYRTSDPKFKLFFKGIDFRTFLNTHESGFAQEEVMIFKRSTKLVSNMPGHPNILSPPRTLVTISTTGTSTPVVCGILYPFYPNRNLAEIIEKKQCSG